MPTKKAVQSLLGLWVALLLLGLPTLVFASQLENTVWDFSGSFSWKVQDGSDIYSSSHRVVGGVLVFEGAGWKASWYEIPANKAFRPSSYSGQGEYSASGNKVTIQQFFLSAIETPYRTATNKNGSSMTMKWSESQENGTAKTAEKGNLVFKRRLNTPTDLTGEWSGNATGKIKGAVEFTIAPKTEEEIGLLPGLYSAVGTMPGPDGTTLDVGVDLALGPRNQVLYGLLWASREEDELFFSPQPIRGGYNIRNGKLTLQGRLVKEECDDDYVECKVVRTLPFTITVVKIP